MDGRASRPRRAEQMPPNYGSGIQVRAGDFAQCEDVGAGFVIGFGLGTPPADLRVAVTHYKAASGELIEHATPHITLDTAARWLPIPWPGNPQPGPDGMEATTESATS
jgi:hypothetical protein